MNRMKTATSAVLHPATSMMNSVRLISAWPRARSRTRWLDISLPSEASRKSDGARVSSTEPHPNHDCDKPDKPCRRHLRETPVYRIKIKRLSAENHERPKLWGCQHGPTSLVSRNTALRRADLWSRTIAMLRPLCFAKWDRYLDFSGQQWLRKALDTLAQLCRHDSKDPAQVPIPV